MAQYSKCDRDGCGVQWDSGNPGRSHYYVYEYDGKGESVGEVATYDFCSLHCLALWAEGQE